MLCSLLTFLHSKILNAIARWRNVRFNFNSNKTNWVCLLTWIYEWSESAKVKGKCSSLGQIFSWLACVGGGNKEEGFDYQRRKDILTLLPKALSPCFFLVNWLVSQAHQCCGRIRLWKYSCLFCDVLLTTGVMEKFCSKLPPLTAVSTLAIAPPTSALPKPWRFCEQSHAETEIKYTTNRPSHRYCSSHIQLYLRFMVEEVKV